jgi:hypothetical protein
MDNPFLTRARPVIDALSHSISMYEDLEEEARARELKNQLRRHYAYAVPDEKAIRVLVGLSPIVEIGAGLGYWASLIEQEGGSAICYDNCPPQWQENGYLSRDTGYHPILSGGPPQAEAHSDRTLFLCWPDDFNQEAGWSDQTLERYLDSGGHTLALVSEGPGNAAGSDRLFELAASRMKKTRTVHHPKFPSLYDRLDIYRA